MQIERGDQMKLIVDFGIVNPLAADSLSTDGNAGSGDGFDEIVILEQANADSIDGLKSLQTAFDRHPSVYSLTSPCLPPISPKNQVWPLDLPPLFDGHPPYPAGPQLLRIAYPRDIPGPTYACPRCDGRFLYHRPSGIVECPFCHSSVSIGHYVRARAGSFIAFGLLLLIASLAFSIINIALFGSWQLCYIAVGLMILIAVVLLLRALHLHSNYKETERIEFT